MMRYLGLGFRWDDTKSLFIDTLWADLAKNTIMTSVVQIRIL